MDSTSIDLNGSTIGAIAIDGDTVRIRFSPAYLTKTMTGSVERTRWWQEGALVFSGAEFSAPPLSSFPATCSGGDVGENIYTYRDMLPVPLDSAGQAHCRLKTEHGDICLTASGVRLEMEGVPKYIEHLRD